MPAAVPVSRVAALCNPLENWPWACQPPSRAELDVLLKSAPLVDRPVQTVGSPELHIGRIRYLMLSGWDDAIELDVGCPVLGYWGPKWPCTDGNHRLAAAICRADPTILVDVAGQLDHAAELLGVPEDILLNDHARN